MLSYSFKSIKNAFDGCLLILLIVKVIPFFLTILLNNKFFPRFDSYSKRNNICEKLKIFFPQPCRSVRVAYFSSGKMCLNELFLHAQFAICLTHCGKAVNISGSLWKSCLTVHVYNPNSYANDWC